MPTEIVFAGGASVKVTADTDEVAIALTTGEAKLSTQRFAGFRGVEEVGGEAVVVRVASIAYAIAISAP